MDESGDGVTSSMREQIRAVMTNTAFSATEKQRRILEIRGFAAGGTGDVADTGDAGESSSDDAGDEEGLPDPTVETPPLWRRIVQDPDLSRILRERVDLEPRCSESTAPLIDEDDFFGYACNVAPYNGLYNLAADGTGGAFHLWATSGDDGMPVVYLGSEGERAKVGRSAEEHLQIALSLTPHYLGVLGHLPGINTLPHNGNIAGATKADFDVGRVLTLLEAWMAGGGEDDSIARNEAGIALAALGLSRLNAEDALRLLCEAHLSDPRFAVESEC